MPLIFIGGKSQGSPCFLFSIILPSDLAVRTPDCISDTSLESICTTSALLHSLTCHLPPGLASPSQLSYWTSTQLPLWPVFYTVVGSLFQSTCPFRSQIKCFHRLSKVCRTRSKLLSMAFQTHPFLDLTYLASLILPQKVTLSPLSAY